MSDEKSCFIRLRSVLNKPGNPVHEVCLSVRSIFAFGVADDEMIKIGASGFVDFLNGMRFYVVETMEEIDAAIEEAEKRVTR